MVECLTWISFVSEQIFYRSITRRVFQHAESTMNSSVTVVDKLVTEKFVIDCDTGLHISLRGTFQDKCLAKAHLP